MIKNYFGWLNENENMIKELSELNLIPFEKHKDHASEHEFPGFDMIEKKLGAPGTEIYAFFPSNEEAPEFDLMTKLFNAVEGELFSDLEKVWESPVGNKSSNYIRYSGDDAPLRYCVWDGLMWENPNIYVSVKSLKDYFTKLGEYETIKKLDVELVNFLNKHGFVKPEVFAKLRGKVGTHRFGL